jgi:hypothetical protein
MGITAMTAKVASFLGVIPLLPGRSAMSGIAIKSEIRVR